MLAIAQHQLRAAKGEHAVAGLHIDFMATLAQLLQHGGVEGRLHRHTLAAGHTPARCIGRSLRVLAVAQHAQRHLQMALALHGAAHHSESHLRRAVGLHGKGRDDGVRGSLRGPTSLA